MGRKLNLSHLTEEECERILSVLQKDLEVRKTEKERIESAESSLQSEHKRTEILSKEVSFNRKCCIRCFQVFGLIFNRRRQCCSCTYYVCKDCCSYQPDDKSYVCHMCAKEKDLVKQSGSWFYEAAGQKFRRQGSAKVVRSLYKTSSYSDTELDTGYTGSGASRYLYTTTTAATTSSLSKAGDVGEEAEDEDSDELPSGSASASPRPPSSHSAGSRPVSRAGSLDTLNLLSSSPSSSTSSRQLRPRTPDPSPSRRQRGKEKEKDADKARAVESYRALPKWDDEDRRRAKGPPAKNSRDLYKHAFESAKKAEENKFKGKFDVLLNDLHRTLNTQSPHALADSFASTSYGEVMLSFRGRVKDLLIGFSQRLQLAYESFGGRDSPDDHNQQVKQNVSRFLEDLLGESLDLTSDEAVSDLSSLSDDSASDRHAFEDQIAQAVVAKIFENHRREAHNNIHDKHRLRDPLSSPLLIPAAFDDDDDEVNDDRSPTPENVNVKDTDISKDFEDLKNFVQETQSRSRHWDDYSLGADSPYGTEGEGDSRVEARASSSFDTHSRDRDFPSLPDFSEFDHLDFNSGEVDPDLIQMNLAVIPEETEEELEEEEASDSHWRENWVFKGHAQPSTDGSRRRITRDGDQPQYMMVPRPDDHLAPRIGNRDVDQLSDLSDNDDATDDDAAFYPGTSEELARISSHKRSSSPLTLSSSSLVPTADDFFTNHHDALRFQDPFVAKKHTRASFTSQMFDEEDEVDMEDVSVGTDDLVGPIVQPSHKDLKLLEELVPADDDDPKFLVPPESVAIQEGEAVKFSCRVAGTQPVDVFWYREHDEVEELEESEDIELQIEGDRHQVTLYNVGRQHAGQYMCIALSDKGKAIKYLTVTVKENKQELKKPEFLKDLKDVEVMEGQTVKFRCKVKGYPPPRISWYKDGSLLRSNRSCRIEKFGNRDYILTLDYATMDDDAEYMVVARNVAGEVRSTAQVIVEPYAEGQSMTPKSRSLSASTVYTDSEPDRPSSTLTDDSLGSHRPLGRDDDDSSQTLPLASGDADVNFLLTKVSKANDNMRQEAESMLLAADELATLNLHLEDMERHLDSLEDGHSYHQPSNTERQFNDILDLGSFTDGDADVEDEIAMREAAKNVRTLTSNALSVLRAAEEIIESEKSGLDLPSPTSHQSDDSSDSRSPLEENNNKTVALGPDSNLPSPSKLSDLNKSVSSGYGSSSVTSSAIDLTDSDSVMAASSVSQQDLPSPLDEFALYLPPLEDDGSGSYRQEVSISLGPSFNSRANGEKSDVTNKDKSSVTNRDKSNVTNRDISSEVVPVSSSANSSFPTRTPDEPKSTSTAEAPSADSVLPKTRPAQRLAGPSQQRADRPDSKLVVSDLTAGSREDEDNALLNFGPKDIPKNVYDRDYEVPRRQKAPDGEEGSERKRWSVTLDPYSPSADVVNRQQNLQDTEEKIYLTAGKMFNLEDRVKDLQSRVNAEASLSDLEDQVAKTAAQVARSEKQVTNIERAVNTLQVSPRSSRGSNSSSSSTPRESIDSGVSSFTPERVERPQPVHMIGQTQEDEVPESRAEYDADSGIELPSVSRLRAMFGSQKKDDDLGDGSFKREAESPPIHSITARSLTKDQLQKLREAGNTNLPDLVRVKDTASPSFQSTQLLRPGVAASGQGHQPDKLSSSSLSISLSQDQQQTPRPAERRQIRTTNLPEPARYQHLDPSNQPVLIYPEEEVGKSAPQTIAPVTRRTRTPTAAPRPKSAVITPSQSSTPNHLRSVQAVTPRERVHSDSEAADAAPTPKIRSGCISARAAFWERRIMQGEATDENVEEEFPEMVQNG